MKKQYLNNKKRRAFTFLFLIALLGLIILVCQCVIIKNIFPMEKPMVIDARGLKHPEPLKKLKEQFSTMCSIDEYVDLLVDEAELNNVKTYAAMSSCEYEIEKLDNHYKIRIKSPCL